MILRKGSLLNGVKGKGSERGRSFILTHLPSPNCPASFRLSPRRHAECDANPSSGLTCNTQQEIRGKEFLGALAAAALAIAMLSALTSAVTGF